MTHRRANPDEIQLRIDPIHADVDEEITGLRSQVRRLRNVAQEIEVEAKSQNAMLNQLDMTVMKAQAWLKNNVRRLNKSTIQSGSNHVVHVVCFALGFFILVYFCLKFF
ncbi:hypothetical protein ACLB2K_046054 [Fragaria x ananassa]